jgi:sugar phosphate isomerase/epimerase
MSRREWHRLVVAGAAAALAKGAWEGTAAAAPVVPHVLAQPYRGVTIGVQSYSFRDRPLRGAIDAMRAIGLRTCELWQGHVEPRGVPRAELRRWRETVSLDEFHRIREACTNAGVEVYAYNISFRDDFSDAEIDRGFEMARALGARAITASSNVSTVPRIAAAAARHKMRAAMHNHSRVDANEFATPESLTDATRAGAFIAINLDIGHFTAADFDALAFLRDHHDRIVTLHIKDRRKGQGPNVPLGEGDTPIGPVLRLLRDQKWPIPANIEYEYKGGNPVDEVTRCFEYCKQQLDR